MNFESADASEMWSLNLVLILPMHTQSHLGFDGSDIVVRSCVTHSSLVRLKHSA